MQLAFILKCTHQILILPRNTIIVEGNVDYNIIMIISTIDHIE